ncbi:hypothetical protein GJV26_20325 [Massilia dura]|uniref:Effector-associated domain-containing protein n=1 Tax=Pseudoduganella dura TaxID=321982 RepID=A0A6I3XM83_9BURK|nr:effector-associated domain EAD1-containing protein [Pseudoduganella dura]MUI14791.1 hypothetical protein [Pseudoduganella dura]
MEQAIYGEVARRGHGLRAASPNALMAEGIASKLDLPDTIPPGDLNWGKFVRGFPLPDYYVLARTFLDPMASRGGMVLTHALFIPLDEMCAVSSLSPLFAKLHSTAAECIGPLEYLQVETSSGTPVAPADLIGTANALTAGGPGPVVRVGVDGFEELIDALWHNLWPSIRRSFAFRLSFGPNDVMVQPSPVLVCTPAQRQGQWTKHPIVKPSDLVPANESAKILIGQRSIAPILALANDLGVDVQSFKDLGRLERLEALFPTANTFDALLSVIRMVDGISSQKDCGERLKNQLIDRFSAVLPSAQPSQLLQLRNLDFAGFPSSAAVWKAMAQVVGDLDFEPLDDLSAMELVTASVDSDRAIAPWREAASAGLGIAAHRTKPTVYKAIWRWAKANSKAFFTALGVLPDDSEIELRLVQVAPKALAVLNQEALLCALVRKRWLTAHGAALGAIAPPLEAVQRQLAAEVDQTSSQGIRAAIGNATPAQVLECAVKLKDARLVDLCAELAWKCPEMLADIRCEEITEQKIWAAAIFKQPALWNSPRNAADVRNTVLTRLESGHAVESGLLDAFSHTPLANLSGTPDRALLWSSLPAALLPRYLDATACGWLDTATATAFNMAPPEPVLECAIVASPRLQQVLGDELKPFEIRLAIVASLPLFGEEALVTWLGNTLRSIRALSTSQAEQLGGLVAARGWKLAAEFLAAKRDDYRNDLLPALRRCEHLLDFYLRLKLKLSTPSRAEKWRALEREACELYPDGPETDELWSRAGGKNYQLGKGTQNGIARWHSALSLVRMGSGPKARELLAEMCQDFPNNEPLRLYAQDTDIVGPH